MENKKSFKLTWFWPLVAVLGIVMAIAGWKWYSASSSTSALKSYKHETDSLRNAMIDSYQQRLYNAKVEMAETVKKAVDSADAANNEMLEEMDYIDADYSTLQLPPTWLGTCNPKLLYEFSTYTTGDVDWWMIRNRISSYFGEARYLQIKPILNSSAGMLLGVMNNPKNKASLASLKKRVFNGNKISEDIIPYLQGTANKKYNAVFLSFFNDHSKKPNAEGGITGCQGWPSFKERFFKAFPTDFGGPDGDGAEGKLKEEYQMWRSIHVLPPATRTIAVQLIKAYNALQ
jgi:hypothetical protein